ncbi:hypothetical protein H4R34_002431 [Dimargaris verticillata]|uniref:RRM domain-containing protein n=1 Tax=Dimargaris verticillata TaxID=2761393 RepID=A0A9W8E9Z9_9FUNG|nr:hypothetical protein H4R34_002431 [Dimargaris verticillata]
MTDPVAKRKLQDESVEQPATKQPRSSSPTPAFETATKVLFNQLPKKMTAEALTELFTTHGIPVVAVKKSSTSATATITCADPNAAAEAKQFALSGNLGSGKVLAKILRSHTKPHGKQATQKLLTDADGNPLPLREVIKHTVTPLWNQAYDSQLRTKKFENLRLLNSFTKEMLKLKPQSAAQTKELAFWRHLSATNAKQHDEATAGDKAQLCKALEAAGLPTEGLRGTKLSEVDKQRYQDIRAQFTIPRFFDLPCPVLDTVASPAVDHYRSKCEFAFGLDSDDNVVLGFQAGKFGTVYDQVAPADDCPNVDATTLDLVRRIRDHVATVVDRFPLYDREAKTGVWRLVMTRTQTTKQSMVVVQYNPTDLTEADITDLHQGLQSCLAPSQVTSLYVQACDQIHNGFNAKFGFTLLAGTPTIHETLMGRDFEISPASFFQVNTRGAERLYALVRYLATTGYEATPEAKQKALSTLQPNELAVTSPQASQTALLDLCCGTGTIGILMASAFAKVIGVEMVEEAVKDAQRNAEANHITNAEFIAGKVEKVLAPELRKLNRPTDQTSDEGESSPSAQPLTSAVAVLDPPRAGVPKSVIASVRNCDKIDRIVFVACDFKLSMQNVIDLCRPTSNTYSGVPFRPVVAIPVDLFPHTKSCELVIELVRNPQSEEE